MVYTVLKVVGIVLGLGASTVVILALYLLWCMCNDPNFFR